MIVFLESSSLSIYIACGYVVCKKCSNQKIFIALEGKAAKKVRVCSHCATIPICLHEIVDVERQTCSDCGTKLKTKRLMLACKHAKEAIEDDVAHGWTPTHATDDHGNWLDAEALAAKKNLTNMVHAIRLHHLGITTAALIAFAYRHNCWHMKTEEVCRERASSNGSTVD